MPDQAIPILISTDTERAAGTYRRLGFTITDHGNYLVMRRGSAELHMAQVDAIPQPPSVAAYIRVDDAGDWYAAFAASAIPGVSAIEDKPWDMREFHLIDQDGNPDRKTVV